MPAMPELYMHRMVERVVPIKREQQLVYCTREEEAKVEIEVLMNMELAIESFPKKWKFLLNRTGKERQVVKFLMKRRILMETCLSRKK
jgi:ATP-dependent RNA helicase RhlE